MMITVFANLLLALFFIGQITLLVWMPILSLILNIVLGIVWCSSGK